MVDGNYFVGCDHKVASIYRTPNTVLYTWNLYNVYTNVISVIIIKKFTAFLIVVEKILCPCFLGHTITLYRDGSFVFRFSLLSPTHPLVIRDLKLQIPSQNCPGLNTWKYSSQADPRENCWYCWGEERNEIYGFD